MSHDWVQRLQLIKERLLGSSPATMPSLTKLPMNLGIDFGTSFTKVCFRDVNGDRSGIATFGTGLDSALLPSVIHIDPSGTLSISTNGSASGTAIPYLKMRLAGEAMGDPLPVIAGVDLEAQDSVHALSAWYLQKVIRKAKEWLLVAERERIKGHEVVWSANVGVPVPYYDSPIIKVFNSVLRVAWHWAQSGIDPRTVQDLLLEFGKAKDAQLPESDFHALPEIAAAIQSFVTSREAQPGLYLFFDIGGGTLDGVAFEFINNSGEKKINFYSGRVESRGVAVIAKCLSRIHGADAEKALVANQLTDGDRTELARVVRALHDQVAYVVMTAKKKNRQNWHHMVTQHWATQVKTLAALRANRDYKPLVIFVGGGGAVSKWYQESILSTYDARAHDKAGIPPYKLAVLPLPQDLEMHGIPGDEFHRFAIAFGLSVPFGEGPEIKLPSQFDEEPVVSELQSHSVTYEDSRDVFD